MKENNTKIGYCGLACMLCSDSLNGNCSGCKITEGKTCDVKVCCKEKNINGCYECDVFPCEKDMFKYTRVTAFNKAIKQNGIDCVVNCLDKNNINGIYYHSPDGSKGDYDKLQNENDIIDLLLYGNKESKK